MAVCMLFSMAACGVNSGQSQTGALENGVSSPPAEISSDGAGRKSLVVYFSRTGNTERVAEAIKKRTGADIFEIIPETPYSDDYNTTTAAAQREQSENARPPIKNRIDNIKDYEVIYVGYPIWWGDMPMLLYTFFDSYDLSGKIILPFCTSGGSGISGTAAAIKELEPGAEVKEGLHIGSSSSASTDSALAGWLERSGIE